MRRNEWFVTPTMGDRPASASFLFGALDGAGQHSGPHVVTVARRRDRRRQQPTRVPAVRHPQPRVARRPLSPGPVAGKLEIYETLVQAIRIASYGSGSVCCKDPACSGFPQGATNVVHRRGSGPAERVSVALTHGAVRKNTILVKPADDFVVTALPSKTAAQTG